MNRQELFKQMFKEDEGICVGDQYKSNVSKRPSITSRTSFYCVNPLDPDIDHGYEQKPQYRRYKPRRADINVSSFRNFLFEMDSVSLEDQLKIIDATEIEFTGIVYSGGKSYHALLSSEEDLGFKPHTIEGIQQYKAVWLQIANLINTTAKDMGFDFDVIDPSCKNPSRLTRMPESIRDNGNEQKIVRIGKAMQKNKWNSLLNRCPKTFKAVIPLDKPRDLDYNVEDSYDFMNVAPKGLVLMIKYPDWIRAEGNYPNLLKIILWGIDSVGVDKDVMTEVCEEYIFPDFKSSRYPKHKWMTAINDAFNMKRGGS